MTVEPVSAARSVPDWWVRSTGCPLLESSEGVCSAPAGRTIAPHPTDPAIGPVTHKGGRERGVDARRRAGRRVGKMSELSRRSLLVGGAATTAAMIAGCTDDGPPDLARGRGDAEPAEVETEPPPAVMTRPLLGSSSLTGDAAGLAAGMSALLFERSLGVIVTADDPEGLRVATSLAATSHWPVLVGSDREPLPEATVTELRRLG